MAQTQSGRIERLERSLKRLGHKLEKRGRGYQIRNGAGTIVRGHRPERGGGVDSGVREATTD